jgi:hypothetical protein
MTGTITRWRSGGALGLLQACDDRSSVGCHWLQILVLSLGGSDGQMLFRLHQFGAARPCDFFCASDR